VAADQEFRFPTVSSCMNYQSWSYITTTHTTMKLVNTPVLFTWAATELILSNRKT